MTTTTDLRTVPRPGPRPPVPGRTGARHALPSRPFARFWRGSTLAPRWERPALLVLLLGTALLYLWNLGASGDANSFYAAAVQAGTQSWKALLFGSLDSSNFITVDKPPASLWIMALSGRIFGFSSWSMLVPQALMGVASVALLRAAVRRWAGPGAGLIAGAALALTPVAVLMFRFNNPDAMLVLCMTAAAYAAVRTVDAAAEKAGTRWMALTGALLGLGFLTKMLQAWLVLPALAAVIVLAAAVTWRRRLVLLGVGLVSMIASVAWYVLLVDLWPTDSRPYIGGSTDNSFLDLVLGYNGLGRIFGGEGNAGGGGGPGGGSGGGNTGFGGSTGITRMFNESFGGQISWLLPAALIVLVPGLWLTRRAPRTDRTRAALLLWGGWLVVHALVFSFMSGTVHAYYSVAMAPGLAGTLAVGGVVLWRRREELAPRLTLAAALAATTVWSVVLLRRTPEFLPWLRWVVAIAGAVAVVLVLAGLVSRRAWLRRALPVLLLSALLAGAGGSVAYAMDTATTAHSGSIVSAGPSSGDGTGMGGGPGGAGGPGRGGTPPSGERPSGMPGAPQGASQGGQGASQGGQGGGPGGMTTTSTELTSLLQNAGTRWSAATIGSQSAASLELSSGSAVMAIGGFSGTDSAPTLAGFQALVAAGDVHYFISSGDGGGMGGQGGSDSVGSEITAWVKAHYTSTTMGGTTVYDLTAPTS
ncbi:glycosyltransferase family 39 protein [Actinomycetospora endophytica]|uniref:Glycosyltransferase family 39 protein n=1 Tax=Actinomycetospora endophytica TaxID=2291215 RepID=A0ABS8P6J9_9PSEU|nr:glycosyltransferase family 39 protein [Actinomycetospora endophytica]MCD2193868.1 glycosyltransferase family 39 protein [Actinomycetospora endophytica]